MRVLLFSTMRWPFAAQLAGAFAALGARVEALCPAGSPLALSRHIGTVHPYHAVSPMRSLTRADSPGLVIPCDDPAAELLARYRGSSPCRRLSFLAAATAAGAPVAESMAAGDPAELDAAIARLGLPIVIKQDPSWGGAGVIVARDRTAAEAALTRLRRPSRLVDLVRWLRTGEASFLTFALYPAHGEISAQHFVPGIPATTSMACWRGKLLAAHHFDVLMTGGEEGGPASVVARRDCPAMEDAARRVAEALNLSGLYGLDYMRGPDGAVHLLEMNARATPTSHLPLTHDLPAALLTAAGFPVRPRPPVTERGEIALFPREWRRDPASPWFSRAFHDVPWDDPKMLEASLKDVPGGASLGALSALAAPGPGRTQGADPAF
jgi:hypothetical protein